ncbi:hypothetical protein THAOC_13897, partial [Thalassiosira oceanica]
RRADHLAVALVLEVVPPNDDLDSFGRVVGLAVGGAQHDVGSDERPAAVVGDVVLDRDRVGIASLDGHVASYDAVPRRDRLSLDRGGGLVVMMLGTSSKRAGLGLRRRSKEECFRKVAQHGFDRLRLRSKMFIIMG